MWRQTRDYTNIGDNKMKKSKSFLIIISIILVLLLLPVIIKDKNHPALVGPELSGLGASFEELATYTISAIEFIKYQQMNNCYMKKFTTSHPTPIHSLPN